MDQRTINQIIDQILRLERPPVPPIVQRLPFEHLYGLYSHIPDLKYNIIFNAKFSSKPKKEIQRVINFYQQNNPKFQKFKWFCGPLSQPDDLHLKLFAMDFSLASTVEIMQLNLSNWKKQEEEILDQNFIFEEVNGNEYHSLFADASGLEMEMKEDIKKYYREIENKLDRRYFFTKIKENDKIIGSAEMLVMNDKKVAYLGGAYTVPDYRRQGIYTHSTTQRLNLLKQQGIENVLVLANSATSRPILEKFGFEKMDKYRVFTFGTD